MRIILISVAVLLLGFVTSSFAAQSDYYLKLDGIKGEETVSGESDWIRLYTVQYRESDFDFVQGISNLNPQTGNEPRWTLGKQIDESSPLLFDAAASGKHIKQGILMMCSDGKCESKILLTDVSIIGISLNSTDANGFEKIMLKSASASSGGPQVVAIPGWIKNNAKWFADGSIGETDFTKGIEYMIKNKIMNIPNLPPQASGVAETKVPGWIKNNAKWWSDGQISDDDFVKGIQYLVEKGIIRV